MPVRLAGRWPGVPAETPEHDRVTVCAQANAREPPLGAASGTSASNVRGAQDPAAHPRRCRQRPRDGLRRAEMDTGRLSGMTRNARATWPRPGTPAKCRRPTAHPNSASCSSCAAADRPPCSHPNRPRITRASAPVPPTSRAHRHIRITGITQLRVRAHRLLVDLCYGDATQACQPGNARGRSQQRLPSSRMRTPRFPRLPARRCAAGDWRRMIPRSCTPRQPPTLRAHGCWNSLLPPRTQEPPSRGRA